MKWLFWASIFVCYGIPWAIGMHLIASRAADVIMRRLRRACVYHGFRKRLKERVWIRDEFGHLRRTFRCYQPRAHHRLCELRCEEAYYGFLKGMIETYKQVEWDHRQEKQ